MSTAFDKPLKITMLLNSPSEGGVRNATRTLGEGFHDWGHTFEEVVIEGRLTTSVTINGSSNKVNFYSRRSKATVKRASDGSDVVGIVEPGAWVGNIYAFSALDPTKSINFAQYHAASDGLSPKQRILDLAVTVAGLKRKNLSRFHAHIAVSEQAKDLKDRYLPTPTTIIPNPIDTNRFTPEGEKNLFPHLDKVIIGYVGRFGKQHPRKGLHYLLQGFSRIQDRYPNAHLVVIGKGSRDGPAEEALRSIPEDRITFAGYVHDLAPAYRSLDILVVPSDGQESFGLVPAEGMASGIPVLASDIPAYKAMMSGHGLQFESRNVESLDGKLRTLLEMSPHQRKRMGEEERRHVVAHYSPRNVSGQYLNLINEIKQNRFKENSVF